VEIVFGRAPAWSEWGRIPRVCVVEDALSGSFHSASASRCAGFFGAGRDDRVWRRGDWALIRRVG